MMVLYRYIAVSTRPKMLIALGCTRLTQNRGRARRNDRSHHGMSLQHPIVDRIAIVGAIGCYGADRVLNLMQHARPREPPRSPRTSGFHVGPEPDHIQANSLSDSGIWESRGGGRHSPCRASLPQSRHPATSYRPPRAPSPFRDTPTVYSCTNATRHGPRQSSPKRCIKRATMLASLSLRRLVGSASRSGRRCFSGWSRQVSRDAIRRWVAALGSCLRGPRDRDRDLSAFGEAEATEGG
jgi:hypothetical protein